MRVALPVTLAFIGEFGWEICRAPAKMQRSPGGCASCEGCAATIVGFILRFVVLVFFRSSPKATIR